MTTIPRPTGGQQRSTCSRLRFAPNRLDGAIDQVGVAVQQGARPRSSQVGFAQGAARSLEEPADQADVDRKLDAWLKEARTRTRIRFRKEAFE